MTTPPGPPGPYHPGPGHGPGPIPGPPGQPPQGARPPGPPPAGPPSGWEGQRPMPREKGLFGSLLDTDFNHLVTPKIIKLWYVVALLLIAGQCLFFLVLGFWLASVTGDGSGDGWAWIVLGLLSPVLCFFEVLTVRIVMEAMVVRFKSTEHLRVIRDKI